MFKEHVIKILIPFAYNLISVQGQQYVHADKLVTLQADKHPQLSQDPENRRRDPIGMEAKAILIHIILMAALRG